MPTELLYESPVGGNLFSVVLCGYIGQGECEGAVFCWYIGRGEFVLACVVVIYETPVGGNLFVWCCVDLLGRGNMFAWGFVDILGEGSL